MSRTIDLEARALARRLGLGDLMNPAVCHGYRNGCLCDACVERSMGSPEEPEPAPQPWEMSA